LAKQTEVKEMLDNMQQHGAMEESASPWSSPVVLVRKKKGVDYKKLNDVTKKDSSTAPD
jgi:hypothetical protein